MTDNPYLSRPWLAAFPEALRRVDVTPRQTIDDAIETAVAKFGNRVAFIEGDATLSFAEFGRECAAVAAKLGTLINDDGRAAVALLLPNSFAFVVLSAAIAKAGMIQVALNPLYTSSEIAQALTDSGARTLVMLAHHVEIAGAALDAGLVDHVIFADDAEPIDDSRCHRLAALPSSASEGFKPALSDIALLQYTGGTTGTAKAAMLTHANLIANQNQIDAMLGAVVDDGAERVLTAIPLYHIFAFTVNFLYFLRHGATNILVADPRDPAQLGGTINRHKPTVITGVNTLFAGLNNAGDALDLSHVKLAIGGGAAIQEVVTKAWAARHGQPILEGYGLSETSPVATLNPPWRIEWQPGIGVPVPGTDIAILDEQGTPVAIGETGEICINGPQVMAGYWKKPAETAEAFFDGTWFRTGDIGHMRPDGQILISDRRKDMILVSGLNVYPNEVEAAAAEHPAILECACVGRPSEKSGEEVQLFVVLRPDAEADAAAIRDHCRSRLAAYKVPSDIRFIHTLPKSAVGKILRRELRSVPGAAA